MQQIIWAVDPFETELKPSPEFVHQLKEWLRHSDIELQPVYVLSSPREDQQAMQVTSHRDFLEEAVKKHFQSIGIQDVRPVQILFDGEATWQNATKKLVDFSLRQNAHALIVSSHGRSGLQRVLFGSFAEHLLGQSPLPIFFLTHAREGARPNAFSRVLFATDLSDASKIAYQKFIQMAEEFHFEILLFHSISVPGIAALGTGFAAGVPDTFIDEQERGALALGERWIEDAAGRGVKARLIIQNEGFDTRTADHILRAAQNEDVGLIAMASVSHPMEAAVAGSVAREVCRANLFPVWVYGPQALVEHEGLGRVGVTRPETHLEV